MEWNVPGMRQKPLETWAIKAREAIYSDLLH